MGRLYLRRSIFYRRGCCLEQCKSFVKLTLSTMMMMKLISTLINLTRRRKERNRAKSPRQLKLLHIVRLNHLHPFLLQKKIQRCLPVRDLQEENHFLPLTQMMIAIMTRMMTRKISKTILQIGGRLLPIHHLEILLRLKKAGMILTRMREMNSGEKHVRRLKQTKLSKLIRLNEKKSLEWRQNWLLKGAWQKLLPLGNKPVLSVKRKKLQRLACRRNKSVRRRKQGRLLVKRLYKK